MAHDDIEWLDEPVSAPASDELLVAGRPRRRYAAGLVVAVLAVGAAVGFALASGDDDDKPVARPTSEPTVQTFLAPSRARVFSREIPVATPSDRFVAAVGDAFDGARFDSVTVSEYMNVQPQYRFTAGRTNIYISRITAANRPVIETRDAHQLIATTRRKNGSGVQVLINSPVRVLSSRDFASAKRLSADPDVPS